MVRVPFHSTRSREIKVAYENNTYANGMGCGPSRTIWPPSWLAEMPSKSAGKGIPPGSPVNNVHPDLTPDLIELLEERKAIMHFEGCLPWEEAEVQALADVLRHAR